MLTGVHLGLYGRDLAGAGPVTLATLVREVLESTGIPRLRLSSVEPQDFGAGLLDLWADARLCRHLHLPLQSGCDATLRRMGRRYTAAAFAALVARARAAIPGLAVTADMIAGLPGETDDEFEESLAFARAMALRAHPRLPVLAAPRHPGRRHAGAGPAAAEAGAVTGAHGAIGGGRRGLRALVLGAGAGRALGRARAAGRGARRSGRD